MIHYFLRSPKIRRRKATVKMSTRKYAQYYEDGIFYEAKVGGMIGDQYLVKFLGYEDDDWQLTDVQDIVESPPAQTARTNKMADPPSNTDVNIPTVTATAAAAAMTKITVNQSNPVPLSTAGCATSAKTPVSKNQAMKATEGISLSKVHIGPSSNKSATKSAADAPASKQSLPAKQPAAIASPSTSESRTKSQDSKLLRVQPHALVRESFQSLNTPTLGQQNLNSIAVTQPSPTLPNKDSINHLVDTIRRDAAGQKRYVSVSVVVQSLLSSLGLKRFEELGMGRVTEVFALKQIADLEDWINTYINCFLARQCMCTLYELENLLARSKGKSNYDDLCMGPLLKHPIVIREFQPPPNVTAIPKVTAFDCAKALADLLRDRKSRESPVQPKDIIDNLMKAKSVADPLELCVRIRGIGLYITHLSAVSNSEHTKLREIVVEIEREQNERISASEQRTKDRMKALFEKIAADENKLDDSVVEFLIGLPQAGNKNRCSPLTKYIAANLDILLQSFGAAQSKRDEKEKKKSTKKKLKKMLRNHDGDEELDDLAETRADTELESMRETAISIFLSQNPLGRAMVKSVLGAIRVSESTDSSLRKDVECTLSAFLPKCPTCAANATPSSNDSADSQDTKRTSKKDLDRRVVIQKIGAHLHRCKKVESIRDLAKVELEVAKDLDSDSFETLGFGSFLSFVSGEAELLGCLERKISFGGSGLDLGEMSQVVLQAKRALQDLPCPSGAPESERITAVLRRHFKIAHESGNLRDRELLEWEQILRDWQEPNT